MKFYIFLAEDVGPLLRSVHMRNRKSRERDKRISPRVTGGELETE
jgi:hypothetical protein